MERGLVATGSDLVYRGFGEVRDLFNITGQVDNIISNVPYGLAEQCARHMLGLVRRKLALILRMTFWESECRAGFFRDHPPARWYVCSSRPSMPRTVMSGERDRFGAIIQPPASGQQPIPGSSGNTDSGASLQRCDCRSETGLWTRLQARH